MSHRLTPVNSPLPSPVHELLESKSRKEGKKKKIFEEIRAENFPNLKKTISSQIQEAPQTPSRRTIRKLLVCDCAHHNQIDESQ